MKHSTADTAAADENSVGLVARLRAENEQLRERVAELEIDVLVKQSVATTYAGLVDEARGWTAIDRLGEPSPVPDRLTTALTFGQRGARVTLDVCGYETTLVLDQVGRHIDAARAAWVFEQIEAVVDEVADQGRPGATGMFRMPLPEQIAALVFRLPDDTPITVISTATDRRALRTALRAAGHQIVREA